MSLNSLASPRCNFDQDKNYSFSEVHQKVLRLSNSTKSCIARSLKGSHSSAMGCSHLKMQGQGMQYDVPICDVEMRCTADLSLAAAPILCGVEPCNWFIQQGGGTRDRRGGFIKTIYHQSH